MGNIVGIAIVWFIIEMLLWYLIAQFTSGWWVFGWFILAAIAGAYLVKRGLATLKPMAGQAQMAMLNPAMRPQENTIVQAIAFAIAGILLILPGILSDIVAIVILMPPVQNKFKAFAKDYATKNPEKLMQIMANRMGGMDPSQLGGLGGMMGGMGGQNPFANSPFGNMNANKSSNNRKFGGTTVDGQAKTVNSTAKRITRSANDD